jgi:hypothetical protein
VFGTLLDKSTGWLSPRLITTILLPLLAFFAGTGALIVTHFGWAATGDRWQALDSSRQLVVAGGAVTALLLLTELSQVFLQPLVRAFEGYWMLQPWAARLGRSRCRAQQRRWDRLVLTDTRDYTRRYREFPTRPDELLPTRLGNAICAAESYVRDSRRYGIDAVFFWPRLYSLLPDALRDSLAAARSTMEQMLFISFLSVVLTPVTLISAIFLQLPLAAWLPVLVGAPVLASLTYRSAVAVALSYGELVRAAFDTHRLALLTSLGYALPTSPEGERELWQAIGQTLYRRDTDRPELLKYHP